MDSEMSRCDNCGTSCARRCAVVIDGAVYMVGPSCAKRFKKASPADLIRSLRDRSIDSSYDPESWYYDWDPKVTLQVVIDRWQKQRPGKDKWGNPMPRQKLRELSQPVMIPIEQIWPHREYRWKRGFSRRSVEEWDELRDQMLKEGWRKSDPLILDIGKSGGVKVGEGNHRLAIAKLIGIKVIPVRFNYYSTRVTKTRIARDPETGHPIPAPRRERKAKPAPIAAPVATRSEPLTKEDDGLDELVNEIMGTLSGQRSDRAEGVACGLCFEWAYKHMLPGDRLVHATILRHPEERRLDPGLRSFEHAWIERGGRTYDWQWAALKMPHHNMTVSQFYRTYKPTHVRKFDDLHADVALARNKHYGPWEIPDISTFPTGYKKPGWVRLTKVRKERG